MIQFLHQSASLDEIAETAPDSKPTIYAHVPREGDTLRSGFARMIAGSTNFKGYEPRGRTVQDKLASLGTEIVERFLDGMISSAGATIAEADRFPALSRQVHNQGDRAATAVSHILNDATNTLLRGSKGPFSRKRSVSTEQIFMDLILPPMMLRALMGEGAKELLCELPTFMCERVSFFLACEIAWNVVPLRGAFRFES